MNGFGFSVPQNIIVGEGTLAKLSDVANKLGKNHAMIISGPSLYRHGIVDRAKGYLEATGVVVDIFTDIEANPSVTTVENATKAYKTADCDFIVALGGGSPMDVAKAVAVVATYGGSIVDYEGAHMVPGEIEPIIAIPTTAGTGSEVTAFSVITDHSRDYKLTVFSYELLPKYAILDASLLTSAPAKVAAACGIDAFIHAFEAYISTAASPFSDAMSEKAMELIGRSIRRFVANRGDMEAANDMLVGSLFAGISFSFARLGNIHAMSHPISAYFDVPHGVANAVLLPIITEFNALADKGKYYKVFNYISPSKLLVNEFEPAMLAPMTKELCDDIGIPNGIVEAVMANKKNDDAKYSLDVKSSVEELIDAMADDAMKSGNIAVNPRASVKGDIVSLYYKAL